MPGPNQDCLVRGQLAQSLLQQSPPAGRPGSRAEDAEIEPFGLEGIPPFNQDLQNDPPEKGKEFKPGVRAADAP